MRKGDEGVNLIFTAVWVSAALEFELICISTLHLHVLISLLVFTPPCSVLYVLYLTHFSEQIHHYTL